MQLWLETLHTPIGDLRVVSDDQAVHAVDFGETEARLHSALRRRWGSGLALLPSPRERPALQALGRYFAGDLEALDTLAVRACGSPLQLAVWKALRSIPAGETTSYAALAESLGRPRAYRAVGTANAHNPIALIVPCHRVIGSDGSLTGYAGGLSRKRWLLEHERARLGSC